MRLSKVAWSILVGGIFIIAFVALYLVYLREQRAQEPLNQSLTVAQTVLPKLTTETTNLENALTETEDRLDEAKSHLQTAEATFPTRRVESIEVDEVLFGIADSWDLEITNLTATEPGDMAAPVEVEMEDIEAEDIEVEDIDFTVTTFIVQVEGEVADILDFIHSVATHTNFTAATIELVTMEVPVPLTDAEKEELTDEEIEQAEIPSATLTLTIYNYQGE